MNVFFMIFFSIIAYIFSRYLYLYKIDYHKEKDDKHDKQALVFAQVLEWKKRNAYILH